MTSTGPTGPAGAPGLPARLSVTLRRDGTVSAHTLDVTGVACLDSVALLEDLLDGTIVHSELTADYVAAPARQDVGQQLPEGEEQLPDYGPR